MGEDALPALASHAAGDATKATNEASDGQTVLQRQLRGGAPRRPTALDAFRLARRRFLAGERLEMSALADELGVNRVTLYRWVGSRDRLLVEILWSVAEHCLQTNLDQLDEAARAEGNQEKGGRVAELLTRFVRDVLTNSGMSRFLRDEGDLAMRLLTLGQGGFQPRFVDLVHRLLAEDVDAGRLATSVPLEDLAFTAVRIVESYVHLHAITGEDPDPERAARVLHALLR
ncbi:MAG: TetR/AcrR family transcriptional regulator [Streptosporangiales bacterium]|nr:TetR/AcrR family transcriptional regulator [Streptosporangiales bacterium]